MTDTCPICMSNKCNLTTNCNHRFCERCLSMWDRSSCPLCRQTILSIENDYNIETRQSTFIVRRNEFIKVVQHFITLLNERSNYNEKLDENILLCKKMIKYIRKNIWFLKSMITLKMYF